MTIKDTPKKWKAEILNLNDKSKWCITEWVENNRRRGESIIAIIGSDVPDENDGTAEQIACAQLMAAAPELLVEAKDCAEYLIACIQELNDALDSNLDEEDPNTAIYLERTSLEVDISRMEEKLARVTVAIDKAEGR